MSDDHPLSERGLMRSDALSTSNVMGVAKVANRRAIPVPRSLEMNGIFEKDLDIASEMLLISLRSYMARDHLTGDTITKTVTMEVVWEDWESWWQHTKAVHFPTLSRWMRRPPRKVERTITSYKDVTIQHDRYAAYPDAPLVIRPELFGGHILIDEWTNWSESLQ